MEREIHLNIDYICFFPLILQVNEKMRCVLLDVSLLTGKFLQMLHLETGIFC